MTGSDTKDWVNRINSREPINTGHHLPEKVITNKSPSIIMVKGLNARYIAVIGIVVAIIILGAVGYLLFLKSGEEGSDGDGDENGGPNRPPVADAGYPITIMSGEELLLTANRSFDPDGDELSYSWDMDAGVDSNNDGIKDNDRDVLGMYIIYTYPPPVDTLTYIVTLNVTDRPLTDPQMKWDTSTVRVTILVNGSATPPDVMMECHYQSATPLTGPYFLVRISDVSSPEFISNFTFHIESPEGDSLLEGRVTDIMVVPLNATIRFIDTPSMTLLDQLDTFDIKDGGEITEGCRFYLYYKGLMDPVGEVELNE
ncbi:MAG: hypothetical protein JXA22_08370 [Candidatus Thermoplasmatota archaeon]|nr:hypothetical protein [Candidatus Thermoplasmatota archaeon]